MKDFNPDTMISASEAKAYAMKRRFEVPCSKRIHVCLYTCEQKNAQPYVYLEYYDEELKINLPSVLLDSFKVWDKNTVNKIGDLGAYFYAFDRKDFFDLFAEYPGDKDNE